MMDGAAEQMNRIYRYQRGIYDLTRRYYLLGRSTLIAELDPPSGGSVLEVGCGTASNLIAAARHYESTRFYGFDVSTEMLSTAERSVARGALAARVRLAAADATTFDGHRVFGVGTYDRIFASYMLSMVPEWKCVLDVMARNLAIGGSIHIVDFGDCGDLPGWFKAALYAWLEAFHVTPRQDLRAVLEEFSDRNGYDLSYARLFRGYAQYCILTQRAR